MSNLPLQPLVWQDLDEDPMLAPVSISESPLHHYVVLKDGEGIKVRYSKKGADFDYATGFATIDEAKQWAWNHYNEKMQPYVKPMPTWIDYGVQKPTEKGSYLIRDHQGRLTVGKFDNVFYMDYGGENWGIVSHWMPIPEFSTMKNNKGE